MMFLASRQQDSRSAVGQQPEPVVDMFLLLALHCMSTSSSDEIQEQEETTSDDEAQARLRVLERVQAETKGDGDVQAGAVAVPLVDEVKNVHHGRGVPGSDVLPAVATEHKSTQLRRFYVWQIGTAVGLHEERFTRASERVSRQIDDLFNIEESLVAIVQHARSSLVAMAASSAERKSDRNDDRTAALAANDLSSLSLWCRDAESVSFAQRLQTHLSRFVDAQSSESKDLLRFSHAELMEQEGDLNALDAADNNRVVPRVFISTAQAWLYPHAPLSDLDERVWTRSQSALILGVASQAFRLALAQGVLLTSASAGLSD